MKKIKKISALILVLMLVLSLSVTAFASADMKDQNGRIGEFSYDGTPTKQDSSVILYKELTVFNPDETEIYGPDISFTYSIAAGTAGALIDDNNGASANPVFDGVKAKVKAGLMPGSVKITGTKADGTAQTTGTSTVAWSHNDIVTASVTGAANKKALTIDFTDVDWSAPANTSEADLVKYGAGVYRYVLTETCAVADYKAAGVTENSNHTRYLDVYVMDGTNGYEIYGYVCFTVLDDIDGANTNVEDNAFKSEGFVKSGTYKADEYKTTNLTVTKTLLKDQMMILHKFPFTVTFTNANATGTFQLKATANDKAQVTTSNGHLTAATMANTDAGSPLIANAGTVKYSGIPDGTVITVKEQNDVNGTSYKSEYSIDEATATGTKYIYTNDYSQEASLTTAFEDNNTTLHKIAFTNSLELISPTGVVLRVAPFIVMLAAGIIILLVTRRYRRREEA